MAELERNAGEKASASWRREVDPAVKHVRPVGEIGTTRPRRCVFPQIEILLGVGFAVANLHKACRPRAFLHITQVKEAFEMPPSRLHPGWHNCMVTVGVQRLLIVRDSGVLRPHAHLIEPEILTAQCSAGKADDLGMHKQPVQRSGTGKGELRLTEKLFVAERGALSWGSTVAEQPSTILHTGEGLRVPGVIVLRPRDDLPKVPKRGVDVLRGHEAWHQHPALTLPGLRRSRQNVVIHGTDYTRIRAYRVITAVCTSFRRTIREAELGPGKATNVAVMAEPHPQETIETTDSEGRRLREFALERDGRPVTGVLWLPPAGSTTPGAPLLCLGHGASGDRHQAPIPWLARRLVLEHGFFALSIDGPVHGRRQQGPGGREAFWPEWRREGAVEDMTADWQQALNAAQSWPEVGTGPVGYWGLSMGTIFGAPFVAAEPRISAAVIGLMGITGPSHYQPRVRAAAEAITCPTLFLMQLEDELFSRLDCLALFDALASKDKRLHANPGLHPQVPMEELHASLTFLVSQLSGQMSERAAAFNISE